MASCFLIDDILQKECEESTTGNMLNNFFYFLKLFEGSTRTCETNQTASQLLLSEVKKQNSGRKTRPAFYLPFISYEHSPK